MNENAGETTDLFDEIIEFISSVSL